MIRLNWLQHPLYTILQHVAYSLARDAVCFDDPKRHLKLQTVGRQVSRQMESGLIDHLRRAAEWLGDGRLQGVHLPCPT